MTGNKTPTISLGKWGGYLPPHPSYVHTQIAWRYFKQAIRRLKHNGYCTYHLFKTQWLLYVPPV